MEKHFFFHMELGLRHMEKEYFHMEQALRHVEKFLFHMEKSLVAPARDRVRSSSVR